MIRNDSVPRVSTILSGGVALLTGTTIGALGSDSNGVTIFTGATNGSRVISLLGSTDDTVTSNIWIYILRGATVIPVGLVNIPLSTGNTSAARFVVDFLDGNNIRGLPVDNTGRQYIPLLAGDVLKASSIANLTAARSVWLTCFAQNFDNP